MRRKRRQGWRAKKTRNANEFSEYYDNDETEFILAMAKYQQENRVRFPKFSEFLKVLKSLGYRKESNGKH